MTKIALLIVSIAAIAQAGPLDDPTFKDAYGSHGDSYTSSTESTGKAYGKHHWPVHFNPKSAVCDRDFLKFVTEAASHFQSSLAEAYQNFRHSFAISGSLSGGFLKGDASGWGKSERKLDSFPAPLLSPGQVTKENAHAYFEADAAVRAARFAAEGALSVDNTARGFVPVVKLLIKSFLIALKAQIIAVCECIGYGSHYKSSCPYWSFVESITREFTECADDYITDMDIDGAHADAHGAYGRAVQALKALPDADHAHHGESGPHHARR